MSDPDLSEFISRYHAALDEFFRGDANLHTAATALLRELADSRQSAHAGRRDAPTASS